MAHVKTLLIFFFVVMALAGMTTLVYSETGGNKEEIDQLNQEIASKKEKVKQLEASIDAYKKKIEQTKLQSVSLSNQMTILDNHITQVELDISATKEKLDTLKLEIQAFELSIADKQMSITRQKKIIAEFIRTLHEEGDTTMIEVLASYDSFSDFYDRVAYARSIQEDVGKSARGLRIAKDELEEKKRGTQERQKAYEALSAELENKKKDLDGQSYAKQLLLTETKSSETTYQTLLSSLKSQYQQVENEITSIEQRIRAKLESQNKLTPTDIEFNGQLSWPTASRYVTAYFRDPTYPYRNVFEHNAIDIRAGHGTAIKAAASGYIAQARFCQLASCYAYVMIVHSGGISTVYGHLSQIAVNTDQFVTRGDIIGYSGGTPGTVGAGPFVTGPHLHFEVRKNGIPVNPLSYLVKDY
jgi:murein DD-endopeptidase MepM/ murein hydrolase activator NlpD